MDKRESIKKLLNMHGNMVELLSGKATEFLTTFPEETRFLGLRLPGDCLEEMINEIMDEEEWSAEDCLALSSAAFFLAINMQKRDTERKSDGKQEDNHSGSNVRG